MAADHFADHRPRPALALVGAGPRGTSVLERICASAAELAPGSRLTVHVIDPAPPGAGQVWRTAQPPELLMNTVASQVTLFTDDSVACAGPIRTGPSLYDWEGCEVGPDDYPGRALYGRYLEWFFRRTVRTAPAGVRVVTHPARAVRLAEAPDGSQSLTLDNGRTLHGLGAVVLAQGHLPAVADAEQRRLADYAAGHGLHYLPPANPADLSAALEALAPGRPVLLRGLGLNFFDHMALLTTARGGRFVRGTDGALTYLPSGREPRLYAGSRRGVPYHARGDNAKGAHGRHLPLLLTEDVIAAFRKRADSGELPDFLDEVWPLVAKEVETVYYEALLARRDAGGVPAPSSGSDSGGASWAARTAAPKRPPPWTRSGSGRASAGTGTGSPGRMRSSRSPGAPPSGSGCWTICGRTSPTPARTMCPARSRRPWTCCGICATSCGRSSTTAGWPVRRAVTTWTAGTPRSTPFSPSGRRGAGSRRWPR